LALRKITRSSLNRGKHRLDEETMVEKGTSRVDPARKASGQCRGYQKRKFPTRDRRRRWEDPRGEIGRRQPSHEKGKKSRGNVGRPSLSKGRGHAGEKFCWKTGLPRAKQKNREEPDSPELDQKKERGKKKKAIGPHVNELNGRRSQSTSECPRSATERQSRAAEKSKLKVPEGARSLCLERKRGNKQRLPSKTGHSPVKNVGSKGRKFPYATEHERRKLRNAT